MFCELNDLKQTKRLTHKFNYFINLLKITLSEKKKKIKINKYKSIIV